VHDLGGQAQLLTDQAHLVLEEGPQRLDELELEVLGQAAHVVVALDVGGAGAAARLHHVGVAGALHQERDLVAALAGHLVAQPLGLGRLDGPADLAAH